MRRRDVDRAVFPPLHPSLSTSPKWGDDAKAILFLRREKGEKNQKILFLFFLFKGVISCPVASDLVSFSLVDLFGDWAPSSDRYGRNRRDK